MIKLLQLIIKMPLAALTLVWFGLLGLGIFAATPFVFLAWSLSKYILPHAKKLEIDSCYTYVWRQFFTKGGAILFIRSKYGWWGHVEWIDSEGTIWEWRDYKRGLAYKEWKPLPPLWFKGVVVKVGNLKKIK